MYISNGILVANNTLNHKLSFRKEEHTMSYFNPYYSIFDHINRIFGSFDKEFREIERELGFRNILPVVSVPAVRYSYHDCVQVYDDGEKVETFKNGKLHGEVVYHDKNKDSEYYIEGRRVTKEEWEAYCQKEADKKIHYITIDDKEYKVTGKQLKELKASLKNILNLEHKKQ